MSTILTRLAQDADDLHRQAGDRLRLICDHRYIVVRLAKTVHDFSDRTIIANAITLARAQGSALSITTRDGTVLTRRVEAAMPLTDGIKEAVRVAKGYFHLVIHGGHELNWIAFDTDRDHPDTPAYMSGDLIAATSGSKLADSIAAAARDL